MLPHCVQRRRLLLADYMIDSFGCVTQLRQLFVAVLFSAGAQVLLAMVSSSCLTQLWLWDMRMLLA
jgi:hypothetical protein